MYKQSLLIAALMAGVPAAAEQPVDETRPMEIGGSISIQTVAGDIDIRAWDKPEFRLTGELAGDEQHLDIRGDAGNWRIEVEEARGDWRWPWGRGAGGGTYLELSVPASALVSARTVSGELDISGLSGDWLRVTSVSGNMAIETANAEYEIETVSGDTTIRGDGGRLDAETVSGDIDARGITGHAIAETVSGDFNLLATAVNELDMSSVSGDMELAVTPSPDARLQLESHSGTIDLILPADTRFRLDFDSFSGDLENEFGQDNDGALRIEAETFSGTVRIRKQ